MQLSMSGGGGTGRVPLGVPMSAHDNSGANPPPAWSNCEYKHLYSISTSSYQLDSLQQLTV